MNSKQTIVFVCEHGAAKSILAATYFNHLANQSGAHLRAVARGTHPDSQLSKQAIEGLSKDGLDPTESMPQELSLDEISSTERIVSFCEIPDEYKDRIVVEHWEGIPAISEDYDNARDAILKRINHLLDNLRSSR